MSFRLGLPFLSGSLYYIVCIFHVAIWTDLCRPCVGLQHVDHHRHPDSADGHFLWHLQALVQDAVLKFKKERVSRPDMSQHGSAEIIPLVKTEAEHVRLLASQPEMSHINPQRESHGALPGATSLQERHSVV